MDAQKNVNVTRSHDGRALPHVMLPGLTDSSKGQPDVACGSESRERERDDSVIDSEGGGMWWKERKGGGT